MHVLFFVLRFGFTLCDFYLQKYTSKGFEKTGTGEHFLAYFAFVNAQFEMTQKNDISQTETYFPSKILLCEFFSTLLKVNQDGGPNKKYTSFFNKVLKNSKNSKVLIFQSLLEKVDCAVSLLFVSF